MLVEHGGHLKFTDNWARNVLNEVQRSEKKMVERMATTSKIQIATRLLKQEQLMFQRNIQALIKWHDIPKDIVLNFNQMLLSYITVGNNSLEFEGAKSVPAIAQKMKLSIKDSFSKCDQIRRKLRIWSHLLKKSLMENFIFCAVSEG